nr:chloride channel protein [Aciditerrimonas ferrireducens]
MAVLHAVQHLAYGYRHGDFQSGVRRAPAWRPLVVLAAGGLVLGTAWVVLRRVGGPVRGLSEAVWQKAGELPFVDTVVNGVLQIVAVGAGATLGREGAPKEVGAGWASLLCRRGRLGPAERQLLVACGAGAGMAAVYNVPLGGALFAAEVLLGTLALPVALPALAVAGVATAVSWLLLPEQPTYRVAPTTTDASLVLFAVVLGVAAGALSAGLVRGVSWAKGRQRRGPVLTVLAITLVFAAVGGVASGLPEVLGNGKDVAQAALSGSLALGTVAAVLVARPLATAACLRSGAVGGLFTPTLTMGCLLGLLAGRGWTGLWPGPSTPAVAMVGACALLAGTMQAPLAALALVVELTHSGLALVVPLGLAAVAATEVSRALVPASIYDVTLLGSQARPTGPGDPGGAQAGRSWWPPNWRRMAERTRLAKLSRSRSGPRRSPRPGRPDPRGRGTRRGPGPSGPGATSR